MAVNLCPKHNGSKTQYVQHLVAKTFMGFEAGGHEQVLTHIDGDTRNNAISNLKVISQREVVTNRVLRDRGDNHAVGARKPQGLNKNWFAVLTIKGEAYYLGSFPDKEQAAKAYQKALADWLERGITPKKSKRRQK